MIPGGAVRHLGSRPQSAAGDHRRPLRSRHEPRRRLQLHRLHRHSAAVTSAGAAAARQEGEVKAAVVVGAKIDRASAPGALSSEVAAAAAAEAAAG